MAVVNLKSTMITDRDATPVVLLDPMVSGGKLQEAQGYITAGAADSIASVYRLCQVPSNCRISQLMVSCGAITSAAADVGVYYPTTPAGAAGAVIDADYFGTAVSIATALTNSDITNESGTNTVAKQEQPLWQAIGLSSDPGGYLDIALTLTAAATASADVSLKARFILG